MNENVLDLVRDSGIELKIADRSLRPTMSLESWDSKLLKPRDCVRMLELGVRDVSFSGTDLLRELETSNVVSVMDTLLDPVRIVAAAGTYMLDDEGKLKVPKGRPLRIATEYPLLTKEWVRANALQAVLVETSGATEVFPPEDADIIVDNTATGTTLRINGLHIFDTLMHSSTHLVASRAALDNPKKKAEIDSFALALRSVMEARKLVKLEFNVAPDVQLEGILALPGLGGMLHPTVSPLHGSGHAVCIAVQKRKVPALLSSIKSRGGTDLLVSQIHNLLR